jgi:hypothetical protein
MGRQFADDSMTPDPIKVSRDKYMDEIPSDRPMHENTTPGHSNPAYTGRQYDDDVKSGTNVGAAPKATVQGVAGDKADRGPEN